MCPFFIKSLASRIISYPSRLALTILTTIESIVLRFLTIIPMDGVVMIRADSFVLATLMNFTDWLSTATKEYHIEIAELEI